MMTDSRTRAADVAGFPGKRLESQVVVPREAQNQCWVSTEANLGDAGFFPIIFQGNKAGLGKKVDSPDGALEVISWRDGLLDGILYWSPVSSSVGHSDSATQFQPSNCHGRKK